MVRFEIADPDNSEESKDFFLATLASLFIDFWH